MKKLIKQLLFAGMLVLSVNTFGQSSKTVSAPAVTITNTQSVALTPQNGISISYQTGFSSEGMVMCLIFKNTNSSESNFTWTLKNKMDKVVYVSNTIKVECGQTIDMNNTGNNNSKFVIALSTGTTADDYKIQITPTK
jgi:hypothetical protein